MDTNSLPGFTVAIPLAGLHAEQYFTASQQAIQALGWQITAVSANSITCRTQGAFSSLGEEVTITVDKDQAVVNSRAVNEYYWHDHQDQRNAEQFQTAVNLTIEQARKADKIANPLTREKYGALIPSKTYLVTPILAYVNVLVFLLMVMTGISPLSPSVPSLLAWGGNFRPAVIEGEWWRLLTHMFLHGGALHLFMNMYALLYIGMMLEPLLGKFRFGAAYILSGVCGGLLSLYFHSYSVGVGASGAIFGMYGVFLAMLTTNYITKTARNTMLRSILFFVVFNLIYGLQGNTDNAAHTGGLISGLAFGYIYFPGIAKTHAIKKQVITTLLMAVGVLLITIFTVRGLTDDLSIYRQKMQQFSDIEARALKAYDLDSTHSKQEVLRYIQDSGIAYWNQDIKLLHEAQQLTLPPQLQARNKKLLEYCDTRIKQYNLIYHNISQPTTLDETKVKELQEDIARILGELK